MSYFHLHSVLGKSTIGDIIKEKEKWLAVPADSEDSTRSRNAQHQQLDDALYLWFSDMSAYHAAINDEMLLTKARQLGQQIGVTGFSYSRGYLHRFKSRRGIKRKLYEGEADSADMTAVQSGRQDLQRVLRDYDTEDIYNLDETGLFYRLGPNYTLATKKVSGTQRQDHSRPCSQRHRDNKDKTICDHQSSTTPMLRKELQPRVLCAVPTQRQGLDDSRPVQGVVERF